MKKAISLLLAVLMITIGVVPTMASETDEIQEIIFISDEEFFADTFKVSSASYSLNNIANNGVVYDYNVTLEEDGTYSASMEFDVVINGTAYRATAFGTLDAVELDNGNIYLSGPLDGTIEVGNNEYKIIVGFQTEYGSNEIAAGITLENDGILNFAFGQYEMPDEIFEEYYANTPSETTQVLSTTNDQNISTFSQGSFYHIDTIPESSNYSSDIVHTLKVYYNNSGDFLAATVTSNSGVFLRDSFYSTSKVYSTKTVFEHVYETGELPYSYINRIVYGADVDIDNTSIGNFLYSVYEILKTFTGISIPGDSVINQLLNSSGGRISYTYNGSETKCTITTMPPTNYDNNGVDKVPLALVVECAHSDSPGYHDYKITSELRYSCTYIKQVYYIDANDIVTDVFSVHVD